VAATLVVVVTVAVVLAGGVTVALVELVVEAEVVDAVRELCPVDGLKTIYVTRTKLGRHYYTAARHKVCSSVGLHEQKHTSHFKNGVFWDFTPCGS
jgi:hypothetical protein